MQINNLIDSVKKALKDNNINIEDFSLKELEDMLFDLNDNDMELDFEPNINWWVKNHNFRKKVKKKNL